MRSNEPYTTGGRTSGYTRRIPLLLAAILLCTTGAIAQVQEEQPDMTIGATVRTEVLEGVIRELNKGYVFPEVAASMEKDLRGRMKRGEYDTVTSAEVFCRLLTSQLQGISHDKHLHLTYSADAQIVAGVGDKMSVDEQAVYRRIASMQNYGFQKLERLPGNIGYMDLRNFHDASIASETAVAAMNFLANTDALIIDLRQNGGGDPAMVALLCTYLFGPEPVHLNTLYDRPSDKSHQWWTLPYVPGRRYADKDVYVLTSHNTFSAAEEFTYNLKTLKRATVIGETTGGGAHPGGLQLINEHFGVWVPTGRAINPITNTDWEGAGVVPDVEVAAPYALKTAYLSALRKAEAATDDPVLAGQLTKMIDLNQKDLDEMKKAPASSADSNAAR
jgi:hypothetical protein